MLLALLACDDPSTDPPDSDTYVASVECTSESQAEQDLYDEVWRRLNRTYPYFEYKEIDWFALGEECRSKVCIGSDPYDRLVNDALECLLAPLRDLHVWVVDRDGYGHTYRTSGLAPNSDPDLTSRLLDEGSEQSGSRSHTGTLSEGTVGYIRVDDFSDIPIAELGGLVSQVGDVSGMIIDARENGGGHVYFAMLLAGQFTAETERQYAYRVERSGGDGDSTTHDLGDPVPATLLPAAIADATFEHPVAVLIGADCMSACEDFVLMAKELFANVRLFGSTTRGTGGSSEDHVLADGLTLVSAPSSAILFADGVTHLEWTGVAPDDWVDFFGRDDDEVIRAALNWLIAR